MENNNNFEINVSIVNINEFIIVFLKKFQKSIKNITIINFPQNSVIEMFAVHFEQIIKF